MADFNERNLAAAIRRAMLEQGLTQQDLADTLEVRQPTISDILNGRQGILTPTARRLLERLNLKVIVVKRD
jgi:plasmid maintenance system antidote protein VapI